MKNELFILLGIIILISCTSCGKDKPKEAVYFKLTYPISVTPIKDTFNIGDTLFLEANFSDTLLDIVSNKTYILPDSFNFGSFLSIVKLTDKNISYGNMPSAVQAFNYQNYKGGITGIGSESVHYQEIFNNKRYFFKYAIIPNAIGVYSLWPIGKIFEAPNDNLSFLGDLGYNANGVKRYACQLIFYPNINNGNTNYDILQQNCIPFDETPHSLPNKNQFFTFVVK